MLSLVPEHLCFTCYLLSLAIASFYIPFSAFNFSLFLPFSWNMLIKPDVCKAEQKEYRQHINSHGPTENEPIQRSKYVGVMKIVASSLVYVYIFSRLLIFFFLKKCNSRSWRRVDFHTHTHLSAHVCLSTVANATTTAATTKKKSKENHFHIFFLFFVLS